MRKHYDFTNGSRNPYAKRIKKQITIRIEEGTLAYFQNLARETAIPYQTLINMYLKDCAVQRKQLRLQWRPTAAP